MAGELGLFGRARFKIAPDRSKFDPDLHPEHAPWVPEENGQAYFDLIRKRTAGRGSGHSSSTAKLHKRNGKAWVSFATAHAGVAFEWGSYAQPRNFILSSSAAQFNKRSENEDVKKARTHRTEKAKQDGRERLRRGIREDLKLKLTGPHARGEKVAETVRKRLLAALDLAPKSHPATRVLPHHVLERLKKPFRATEDTPSTRPGQKLLARLRNIESRRELSAFIDGVTP